MKTKLKEILERGNININEIYDFFENTEDVLIIKYDGIRNQSKFNIILIAKESRFETINIQTDNLQLGLRLVLEKYQTFLD